jgi:hypothetical protein
VIKRMNLPRDPPREVEWPLDEDRNEGRLFSGRSPLRKVVVLVDAELIDVLSDTNLPAFGTTDAASLLSWILSDPFVRLYRYADGGPPKDLKPDRVAYETPLYKDWAVVHKDELSDGTRGVLVATDNGYSLAGIFGNAVDVAESDTRTDAYGEMESGAASERRRADALAAQVASQAVHADIYVTERPYLHQASWDIAQGVTICSVHEAVGLLALYFRAQRKFSVAYRFTFNRGLFYWVGARELLPAGWRWFSACGQHSHATGDDSLALLAGSLLQRVDRALETRDAVHVALNQPQNNDVRDDALASLDIVLVLLMGAIDAAARVAHRVLGLPPATEYRAAWQDRKKGGWFEMVRTVAPNLARVMDAGTDHDHALTVVRLLRNCVHGAALQGIALEDGGSPQQTLVALPTPDERALLAAMDALGGRASWAVTPVLPNRTHVDPGVVVDRLFEVVPALLNDVMARTPVESLDHVRLGVGADQPPQSSDLSDPFAPWIRQSIRSQLGL